MVYNGKLKLVYHTGLPYKKKYHGTTMVYHGKQWYTMVQITCTMVHCIHAMVHSILYHGMLLCTMVQPCATMVHPWYK